MGTAKGIKWNPPNVPLETDGYDSKYGVEAIKHETVQTHRYFNGYEKENTGSAEVKQFDITAAEHMGIKR